MKILYICSNLIGDTILSSGVINHFIEQNKEAKLTFVVGPTAAPLLKLQKSSRPKVKSKSFGSLMSVRIGSNMPMNLKDAKKNSLKRLISKYLLLEKFGVELAGGVADNVDKRLHG